MHQFDKGLQLLTMYIASFYSDITFAILQSFLYCAVEVVYKTVVYFDQLVGASHTVGWSKSSFGAF